jgi:hypothetical protein
LPQLPPPVAKIYRPLWIILFIACVLSATVYGFLSRVELIKSERAYRYVGLRDTGLAPAGVAVRPIDATAREAGIADGDAIVAIDGAPAPRDDFRVGEMLSGSDGATVQLDLIAPTGVQHKSTLVRDRTHLDRVYRGSILSFEARHWFLYWLGAIAQCVALTCALLLFLRRTRDPVAALLSTGIMIAAALPPRLTPLVLALNTLAIACIYTAVIIFPAGRFDNRWTWIALILTGLLAAANLGSAWLHIPDPVITSLAVCTLISALLALTVRYRRLPSGIERQQIKFAVFGFSISIVTAIVAQVLAGIAMANVEETARSSLTLVSAFFTAVSAIAFNLGLLVALLRYRLYDAESVISRSAGFAFLTLLLGATFAASQNAIQVLGERFLGQENGALSAGIAAGIAAIAIAPLHNRIQRWSERRFHRRLAALEQDLPQIVQDMREFASLEGLIKVATDHIRAATRATTAAVLLDGAPGNDGGTHFALDAKGAGHVGWLSVGPRPDGSPPGRDEREALKTIAPSIARAIHIIQHREIRERLLDARIGALENRESRSTN